MCTSAPQRNAAPQPLLQRNQTHKDHHDLRKILLQELPAALSLAPVLLPGMPPAAGQRAGRLQPIPSWERRVALSEL